MQISGQLPLTADINSINKHQKNPEQKRSEFFDGKEIKNSTASLNSISNILLSPLRHMGFTF